MLVFLPFIRIVVNMIESYSVVCKVTNSGLDSFFSVNWVQLMLLA